MEAVPRLPMLSFEFRTCAGTVDFASKLKQYIRNHYGEDPTLYASGITGIESMRQSAMYPSTNISSCSLLKRYYCQLHFMMGRFPMRSGEEAAVPFSWKALHSNTTITLDDIYLEMSSILYNIGAIHTQLGDVDNRTVADELKMSCTHFQCAAWAFGHILEEFPFSERYGFPEVLITFMYHICLAQAQECILEKSMMDNRKSAITAKVAVQVVDYYRISSKVLKDWPKDDTNCSEISRSKVFKIWEKYVQFKKVYYESISLLYRGQQAEEQEKGGERVAFYQAACEKLEEARKLASGLENQEKVNEALVFVNDVTEGKRNAAKRENEFIYHEDVPNLANLPKIEGASLVKGIPFSVNDPEVCGPDLFSNIVPMKVHEYSSLYSEEKAKLLRKINGLVENKNEELETFLSMLDLAEIKAKGDKNLLPQELVDRCAALNANPDSIKNLTDAMNKLSDVYHDVEAMLKEIQELLKEEESNEKEYQQMVGKRPPSIAATDLTREAKKYQEARSKASESNQTLHKAMVMHIPNLKLLSLPLKELINHIPTIPENPEADAVTNEMRHLISKVEEMNQQRLMLSKQLRDTVCQDDITKQLLTVNANGIKSLFEQELKKYDKTVGLIEQNLAAQENILKALKDAYARYGSTRKTTGEAYRKRTAMISSLIASYDAYEDLIAKSSKGLDFYKKLETNVSKLLQRVKGTCKVQDEEREQMLKTVKKPETVIPQPEAPAANTLKLKDYLNIKKETGKLSLDQPNSAPPAPYFNDPTMNQQNWIPGVRPAPLGSEETNTNLNITDTFKGFYQGQGKDQVWSNAFYSLPQTNDQKLKYYLPQNSPSFQDYSQSSPQSQGPDLYPISSYSTAMPKTEGHGYEPKSNYYEIRSSPNRIYNPTQSYSEVTAISTNTSPYQTAEVNYNNIPTSNFYSPNSLPTQYGYPQSNSNYPATQGYISQQTLPGYATGNETGVYGSATPGTNQTSAAYSSTFPQTDPSLANASNAYYPTSVPANYNSFPAGQPSSFNSSVQDETTANYPSSYQTPVQTSLASNFTPQSETFTPNVSYENQASNFSTTFQTPYSYGGTSNGYYQPTASDVAPVQYPTSLDVSQTWQGSYSSNLEGQQYFQSGNESLYTASQTPNSYAMTNSDVYKAAEVQGGNPVADPTYGGHYYTNQYGAGGQTDSSAQKGNMMTYMQAGTDKQQAVTKTTFSNSEAKSSPVTNPSNVDLLAGLDFNIDHSPLVPESSVTAKKEPTDESADKSKTAESTANETAQAEVKSTVEPTKEKVDEKAPPKDWMSNADSVAHFVQDVEKYEKFVEGLTLKTLNGPTSLDLKWKEIVDHQEKISPQHIISVARCYPMKNRFPDILPYDDSRVELPSTKDDYINASKMKDLTKLTPPFILTQAPIPSTYSDFWAMVFEQQVEVIVCLLKDSELEGHIYWPSEKGQELELGKLKISLQSSNVRPNWVERIFSISVLETRVSRVVIHLQFTAWPGSSFPDSPGPFLSFSSECLNFFSQQRSFSHPVVVHCLSGVGRTGLFCLIIACLLDIQAGKGIPDVAALAMRMCQFRKSCLRDREHLKFAYQTVLYYCQDFLMKRGILTNSSFDDKKSTGRCHTRHPSQDFLVNPGTDTDQVQAGIERIDINSQEKKSESDSKGVAAAEGRSQSGCSASSTSSGRTSPSSLLADVESSGLNLKVSPGDKKKRFTSDDFNKSSTLDGSKASSDDPFSQLDPLWTMKK